MGRGASSPHVRSLRLGLTVSLLLASFSATARADAPVASCEEPTLWLAFYAVDDVSDAYCAACPERCADPDDPARDGAMALELIERVDGVPCEEIEYAQRAIEAVLGVPVPSARWRAYLASRPWYRPGRAAPSAVARTNLRWLARAHARCLRDRPPAPAWVRRRVERFFASLRAGRLTLPSIRFDHERPATEAQMLEVLSRLAPFTPRTPVSRADPSARGGPGTWRVDSSHVASDCLHHGDEACEGFFGVELTFNPDHELRAVHVYSVG